LLRFFPFSHKIAHNLKSTIVSGA